MYNGTVNVMQWHIFEYFKIELFVSELLLDCKIHIIVTGLIVMRCRRCYWWSSCVISLFLCCPKTVECVTHAMCESSVVHVDTIEVGSGWPSLHPRVFVVTSPGIPWLVSPVPKIELPMTVKRQFIFSHSLGVCYSRHVIMTLNIYYNDIREFLVYL